MTDHKFDRQTDRQVVLDDFKRRVIDLMDGNFTSPATAWDEEPVRYFKLNKKWAILLAGVLDIMEDVAFWKDASDESYAGIQGILSFEEGIELPDVGDLDCEDVEDCLETSTIINNITNNITNIEETVDDLEEQTNTGLVDYPPAPDLLDGGDLVCRGAYFISQRLSDLLLDLWTKAADLTISEFLSAIGSLLTWSFIPATEFWQYYYTLLLPDLADNAITYADRIAQAFFCANWQLTTAMAFVAADSSIPDAEKNLWLAFLDNFRQTEIEQYGLIGSVSEEEVDCTNGCPWVVVYNFSGLYEPDSSETAIYDGDTWDTDGAHFEAGVGYLNDSHDCVISHPLPEQCKIHSYGTELRRAGLYLQLRWRVWYRGTSGTDTPTYSDFGTIIDTNFHPATISAFDAVMDIVKVKMTDNVGLGTGVQQSAISFVKLIGFGNAPTE